jgi:hypothetical protein
MVMLRDGSATPAAWLSSGVGEDAWARPDKWATVRLAGSPVPAAVGYTETPIVVDGDTADWEGVPPLATPEGAPFQFCWDEDGVYGLVSSVDDHIHVNPSEPWTADSIQVFLEKDFARSHDHTANSVDVTLWPDPEAGPGPCGMTVYSHALGQNLWPDIATAWAPTPDGYVIEFRLPAEFLRPARMLPGALIGFAVLLRADGQEPVAIAPQDLGDNSWQHPDEWGAIRLVEQVK